MFEGTKGHIGALSFNDWSYRCTEVARSMPYLYVILGDGDLTTVRVLDELLQRRRVNIVQRDHVAVPLEHVVCRKFNIPLVQHTTTTFVDTSTVDGFVCGLLIEFATPWQRDNIPIVAVCFATSPTLTRPHLHLPLNMA